MGRPILIWRLAVKDLSHNALEAVLLLAAIAAAELTLGLSLHGVTNAPYTMGSPSHPNSTLLHRE